VNIEALKAKYSTDTRRKFYSHSSRNLSRLHYHEKIQAILMWLSELGARGHKQSEIVCIPIILCVQTLHLILTWVPEKMCAVIYTHTVNETIFMMDVIRKWFIFHLIWTGQHPFDSGISSAPLNHVRKWTWGEAKLASECASILYTMNRFQICTNCNPYLTFIT